ncbi:hypothetical protein MesoLjLc_72410 [Mesorhizobium sp. L-8-10]|nr:hypothetical protein MesoLjLc_72410 [Mesorhizobium sp. L-8-10]
MFSDKYAGSFPIARAVRVTDSVIQNDLSLGGRSHLDQIRREANGCYDSGFYNACAMMCRRLVELLLIEAFQKGGHINAITAANGELRSFGDIIAATKSKQYVKLSRSAPSTLDKVKATGDAAAHHRYYNTSKRDIDDLNPNLRQLVAELAALAGL